MAPLSHSVWQLGKERAVAQVLCCHATAAMRSTRLLPPRSSVASQTLGGCPQSWLPPCSHPGAGVSREMLSTCQLLQGQGDRSWLSAAAGERERCWGRSLLAGRIASASPPPRAPRWRNARRGGSGEGVVLKPQLLFYLSGSHSAHGTAATCNEHFVFPKRCTNTNVHSPRPLRRCNALARSALYLPRTSSEPQHNWVVMQSHM